MKILLITPDQADFSLFWISLALGFPSGSVVKQSACQYRRLRVCSFDTWVRKIPWRRTWQPTPVFLPGKSHGQRSLVDYTPWGRKELDTAEHACNLSLYLRNGEYIIYVYRLILPPHLGCNPPDLQDDIHFFQKYFLPFVTRCCGFSKCSADN